MNECWENGMKNTYVLPLAVQFSLVMWSTAQSRGLRYGLLSVTCTASHFFFLFFLAWRCLAHWHGSKIMLVILSTCLDSLVKNVGTFVHQYLTGRQTLEYCELLRVTGVKKKFMAEHLQKSSSRTSCCLKQQVDKQIRYCSNS